MDTAKKGALLAVPDLAAELGMPEPVLPPLKDICRKLYEEPYAGLYHKLCDPAEAGETHRTLAALARGIEGETGYAQLAFHLAAALDARERYRELGISDHVFLETMGCFPRFIRETERKCGAFYFDRGFWTWRQTACLIFRLGTLEFEYKTAGPGPLPAGLRADDHILSIHIPSDAVLTDRDLKESYAQAANFIREHGQALCADGLPKAFLCGTWLLSPRLLDFLPEDSGIRRFAGDYALYGFDEEDESYRHWLFNWETRPEAFPEKTSLQKKVKKFVLAGGKVGLGLGRYKYFGQN